MRTQSIVLSLLLAACVSAPASQPAEIAEAQHAHTLAPYDESVSRVASEQPAGEYALDPRHTSVLWRLRHWGLALYTGRFDTVSGSLRFDPNNPAASSVSVTIPVASISTGLLNRAGERAFDRDLTAYLGGQINPEITFVSRTIDVTSPTTGLIHGDLTLNGRTAPATMEATFEGGRVVPTNNRPTVAFAGRMLLQRSVWLEGQVHNSAAPSDWVEILVNVEYAQTPG